MYFSPKKLTIINFGLTIDFAALRTHPFLQINIISYTEKKFYKKKENMEELNNFFKKKATIFNLEKYLY